MGYLWVIYGLSTSKVPDPAPIRYPEGHKKACTGHNAGTGYQVTV
jgi:hypothetical protein